MTIVTSETTGIESRSVGGGDAGVGVAAHFECCWGLLSCVVVVVVVVVGLLVWCWMRWGIVEGSYGSINSYKVEDAVWEWTSRWTVILSCEQSSSTEQGTMLNELLDGAALFFLLKQRNVVLSLCAFSTHVVEAEKKSRTEPTTFLPCRVSLEVLDRTKS